jgi:glycosyltransferase involved in cell wall biosynthesis
LTDIVIHGETGFLVPVGDAHAFSERRSLLVRDANLRLALGVSGRSHVEKLFDAKKNAKRIIDILIASVQYNERI